MTHNIAILYAFGNHIQDKQALTATCKWKQICAVAHLKYYLNVVDSILVLSYNKL